MATTTQVRIRPRPAHTSGPTFCAYTPDGTKLVTVGSNNTTRVYPTGHDGEPTNIDDCPEQNLALATQNGSFIVGAEDGTVSLYSMETMAFQAFLTRCALPIRDISLSKDGIWCAVASDELTVKLVKIEDNAVVKYLREQPKPTKHVEFSPDGEYIVCSCTDGILYIYDLKSDEPELIKKVDALIRPLETESEISSRITWHPDGRAFAAPTAMRDIEVISIGDWEKQRSFASVSGHNGDITALEWSPNGAMLATAGKDGKIILWETKTQNIIARYEFPDVVDLAWHPTKNLFSFTNLEGQVYIHNDFVPLEKVALVELGKQPAPFIHDPLNEVSGNARRPTVNGLKDVAVRRRASVDSLDDILGSDIMGDEDDFVEDDDGAGYAGMNNNGKRTNPYVVPFDVSNKRRGGLWEPQYHPSFQPGATPWRGNRKYLCLNLIGFVWTVDQDTHHTITVEFYDRELYRDFHFTDTFLYDKACLNSNGTLFSSPPSNGNPATIFYRPHETWTERTDWRISLPKDETVTSISLSDSFITATTSSNYVRIWKLCGTPYRLYRQKSSPTVTCTSWRDYVFTLGNGAVGADGTTQLLYTIENIARDEVCQSEDIVALPPDATVKSVFFSDQGDPCIYDSTGTLLTLLHWRTPGQAKWTPLLDTTQLSRLQSGRKQETYWPVALADSKFHCIILKGTEEYPYFPRPLLSEFDLQVPLSSPPAAKEDEEMELDDDEGRVLEAKFVLESIMTSLYSDMVDNTLAGHREKMELAKKELEVNKVLLQLLARECREGEERGMKALELVELMRDPTGKMTEAAIKIAARFGRSVLEEKIREFGERRLLGED